MKKTVFTILLMLAFLLAACNNNETGKIEAPDVPADGVENAITEPDNQPETSPNEVVAPVVIPSTDNPCVVYDPLNMLIPADPNFPPITAADWVDGPDDAAITLTVYDQFDCPGCKYFETQVPLLKEAYGNDFRLVFRHFFFHENADLPARAAEAAGQQGKFFEVKEFIFGDIENWYGKTGSDFETWLRDTAEIFSLDASRLIDDYNSETIIQKVAQDNEAAKQIGISVTPTVYVNGWKYVSNDNTVPGFEKLTPYFEIIKRLKAVEKDTYSSCPDSIINPENTYSATITTTKGDIIVELFADSAPLAVNSFIVLAQDGWYDGNSFITHPDFIFSGDPSDTGFGFPGYAYIDELDEEKIINEAGWLVSYSTIPNLNGSGFFISRTPMEEQGNRTVFGKVVEGLDVLDQFESRENIFEPVKDHILKITILEE